MTRLDAADLVALVTCHVEPPTRALLERVVQHLPRVLVVDDAMAPRQARHLDRLAADLELGVLHLGRRSGKGHAVAAGLRHLREGGAPPDGVMVLDGDGQHPPEHVPAFLAASATSELVIGDRFAAPRDVPLVRRLANRTANRVVSRASGVRVRDSQCGMRLLHGRALHEVGFPGGGYEAETRHLRACLAAGVTIGWVPIPAIYEGQPSSFHPVRDSVAVLRAAAEMP